MGSKPTFVSETASRKTIKESSTVLTLIQPLPTSGFMVTLCFRAEPPPFPAPFSIEKLPELSEMYFGSVSLAASKLVVNGKGKGSRGGGGGWLPLRAVLIVLSV